MNKINIYIVKISVDEEPLGENFMVGGKNINDAISIAEKYAKKVYDSYNNREVEILAVELFHKDIIISKNEI